LVLTALGDRLASLAAADRRIASVAATTRGGSLERPDAHTGRLIEGARRPPAEPPGRAAARLLLREPLTTAPLLPLLRPGTTSTAEGEVSDAEDRINTLTTLIAAHCREPRPVSFYAQSIGVSAAHLNRLARAATGLSVQELAARQLMEAARRDLIFTPTPV